VKINECQICYVAPPATEGRGIYILNSNIIRVLEAILEVEGNRSEIQRIESSCWYISWVPLRIIRTIQIKLKNVFYLLKLCPSNSIIVFSMGFAFFLPLFAARLKNIRTIYFISGLAGTNANSKVMSLIYKQSCFGIGKHVFPTIISNLERLNYNLASIIVVESPSLTKQITFDIFRKKPILNGSLFVDEMAFIPKIQLPNRKCKIGYFGALKEHKGILNFIEAIPLILNERDDANFVIVGTGPECVNIKERLKNNHVFDKVVFYGNIAHKEIPDYLNETKIVVLPSYGEGLPNIVLEAMACGTPVLATSVGGIPDIIKDAKTGFIIEINSPECIASNVIRALEHPDLEGVALRARALVEHEYTFERAVERWKKVLEECGQ